jgi:hypothetical protein
MSYNGSGTYNPPVGNPVEPGSVITSEWANTLVDDISLALTNCVTRDGQGVPSTVLKIVDGSVTSPGLAFNSESSTGVYRPSTNVLALTVAGTQRLRLTTAGVVVTGTHSVSGNASVGGDLTVTGAVSGSNLSSSGGANPSATIGLTATNGSATTFMRSDAAPALNTSISPTWSGTHTFSNTIVGNISGNAGGTAANASQLDSQSGSYYRNASNLNSGTVPTGRLSGTYSIDIDGTAADADLFGGQNSSYYRNADNLNAGTVPSGRLSGTYAISISGTAADASLLGGQNGSYYRNASNLNSGTVPSDRLSGTYAISISGNAATATSATSATSASSATNATNSTNVAITNDTSTNSTHYVAFTSATSGNGSLKVSNTKLTFNPSSGTLTAAGDISAYSDIRLKDNVQTLTNAVETVEKLRGVSFERVDMAGRRQIGVIAQEVKQVVPEVVVDSGRGGYLSVSYGNLVGLLIEAIKEQQAQINLLKSDIAELRGE